MRLGLLGAGVVVAVSGSTGCLDRNPMFEEPLPTGSDSDGATTKVEGMTNGVLSTTTSTTSEGTTVEPGTTTEHEDTHWPLTTTSTSSTTTGMTFVMEMCGDGMVEGGEECDDINPDIDDGCIDCKVPRTCADVRQFVPNVDSGVYEIDVDGMGGYPPLAVYCDMATTGGGWTVIERSPREDPIGTALFVDAAVNSNLPEEPRFRIKKEAIELLLPHVAEMRIDCGGDDYLLTDAGAIFSGEGLPVCARATVVYKEARLKGYALTDTELCTGFHGLAEGCWGAWNVDEYSQQDCGLPPHPWNFMVPITSDGADAFAVDASALDNGQMMPPIHDCHEPGAVRVVMLR
ncbi:fibrinogen-like YCDxxxxGGGW domain-containing protein [Nannocystis sp. ILAH1]|uniref:fibrinogen-like YCDxxxxGGGW domain-containing protein n=1 Tax=unclassified Nannocystis TaxID=2627009 RepID=UPI0022702A81|nr:MULTISPECIES: fibrinogen-like YCDxxxxGGGW domain-containing protein [unclassified Nannocystis]MCY0993504.1 fibrinogen-like YCDxxxxGGGW domain-containing protein [Nannocystis sp. ILAH1]MCY1063768.1 fibrinogen-like YCDxxxxGGGW domain-containing protein [Nannocystis sp. RBIL2]